MTDSGPSSWLQEGGGGHPPVGLTERIGLTGERPDVRAYLERAGSISPADLVAMLCADQVERWRAGERIPTEAYLQLHPSLQGDSPEGFEMVYGEFVLREHLGETPTMQEYLWRFPRFADRLQRQVNLHQALGGGDDSSLSEGGEPSVTLAPGRTGTAASGRTVGGHTIPGYEILGELGRGGMGVVYKARQTSLNRVVALKVIRDRLLASPEEVQRFRSEAEVVARLQHPHIVQIYEVGESDRLSYLALEYVEGGSLQKKLAGAPQDSAVAARLVETLARTVHFAHQRGIIHRDLSPANVLLSFSRESPASAGDARAGDARLNEATPKITDFGLAKQLEGAPGQTRTGDVVGTPSYMAPEQAQGNVRAIGAFTDVYALGAILYELLTGRPPFKGATAMDTLMQLCDRDAVPPRQLQPEVPRDLETICLKCLEKEPPKRYRSAADLADELRRFLDGKPILARPTPGWERAWKWARRRPVIAALTATVVLVAALGFGLVSWQWSLAETRAGAERDAKEDAQRKGREEQKARREVEHLTAGVLLDQGAALCGQGEVDRGLLVLARGLELAERAGAADLERVARLNVALWRQQLVRRRTLFPHDNLVMAGVFSPDGRVVLTCSHDKTARLWEADTGKPIGAPMRHDEPAVCVAFSPDGKRVLTGAGVGRGEARLWDATTGKPLGPMLRHEQAVLAVTFSPRGERFLTVSSQQAQVWKTATCQPEGAPLRHEKGAVLTAIFSPDGKRVLTGGGDGKARLWDADTGKPAGNPLSHNGPVLAAAFSPDGATILTGTANGLARLWDADTRRPQGLPMFHRGPVRAVVFSADGRLLATGSIAAEPDPEKQALRVAGGEACLWERTGKRLGRPLPHPAPVWSVALSPDSHLLLTGCEDGAARLFRVSSGTLIGRPMGGEGTVRTVAFSPDGRALLMTSAGGDLHAAARLWELPPGLDRSTPLPHPHGTAAAVAFSPDGKILLTGHDDGTARLWDVAAGRQTGPLLRHGKQITHVAFSPDGRTMVTVSKGDKAVHLWDSAGRALRKLESAGPIHAVAFSPDGKTVLTGEDSGAQPWETATGKKRGPALPHAKAVYGVGFAADGRTLWTAAGDDTVRQWDGDTRQILHSWRAPGRLCEAVFSPDGRAALAYNDWRYAQFRKLTPGQGRGPLVAHPAPSRQYLTLSANGLFAASAGVDKTARLWDAATGKAIGLPLPHRDPVSRVALRPDGRMLAVAGTGRSHLWEVPAPVRGTAQRVRLWLELVTGLELDEQGSAHELRPEDLGRRRQELERLGGRP